MGERGPLQCPALKRDEAPTHVRVWTALQSTRLREESSHKKSHAWCHSPETSEVHKFLVTKCRSVVARAWPGDGGRCGDNKLE